jgi:parallel beta-helix repeat protein
VPRRDTFNDVTIRGNLSLSATSRIIPLATIPQLNNVRTVDGTTFANLQAALDASTGGGVIFLPEGTHSLTDGATVSDDNITIFGAGVGQTIIQQGADDIDLITLADGVNNFTLRDLTLDGNNQAGTSWGFANPNRGLVICEDAYATGVTDVRIQNVEVKQFRGQGISVTGSFTRVWIEDCYIHDIGDSGAVAEGVAGQGIAVNIGDNSPANIGEFLWVRNNQVSTIYQNTCISVSGVRDSWIEGNRVDTASGPAIQAGNTVDRIWVDGNNVTAVADKAGDAAWPGVSGIGIGFRNTVTNGYITNNIVRDVGSATIGYGIWNSGTGSSEIEVSGNICIDNPTAGIVHQSMNDFKVTDNYVNGNGTGIWINNSARGVVSNNRIVGNTGNGLFLDSNTAASEVQDVVAEGNFIYNNDGHGISMDSAARCIVKGNILRDNEADGTSQISSHSAGPTVTGIISTLPLAQAIR